MKEPKPVIPYKPVVPPSRGGDGRRRPRRPAHGLTLTCTRPSLSRSRAGSLPNLAVELRDVGWGGVQFVAAQPLRQPCSVNLQIRKGASGEVFNARAEIAWSETRKVDGREMHVVGARFDEILTPAEKCARFFEERVAPAPEPQPETGSVPMRRISGRFPVEECEVTLCRDEVFRWFGKPENIASGLVDLSRTGAQVICTESLKRGEKARLTVHLKKFQDTFAAEAETVWTRFPSPHEGCAWRVGLAFGALDRTQKRRLESMERWFTSASARDRSALRPIEKSRPLHA